MKITHWWVCTQFHDTGVCVWDQYADRTQACTAWLAGIKRYAHTPRVSVSVKQL